MTFERFLSTTARRLYTEATGAEWVDDARFNEAEKYIENSGEDDDYAEHDIIEAWNAQQYGVDNIITFRNAIRRHMGKDEHNRTHPTAQRILVFRAVSAPTPSHIHWSNVGSCWAFTTTAAYPYQPPHAVPERWRNEASRQPSKLLVLQHHFVIAGYIKAADVDWDKTVESKIDHAEEDEIRALPGAVIEVVAIAGPWKSKISSPSADITTADWRRFRRSFPAQVHEACGYQAWRPR